MLAVSNKSAKASVKNEDKIFLSGTPIVRESFKMVALDLDGTLLHSNHKLSQTTKDYLRKLDQKGFIIIFATGRAIPTVYEHIADLNLPKPLPVVCSNGAKGMLCSVNKDGSITSKEIFSTPVPQAVATRVIELSREQGYVSQYYFGDDIYADPRLPHHFELTGLYQKLTGCKTRYIDDGLEKLVLTGLPSKQLVLCPIHEQDEMIQSFTNDLTNEKYLIEGKRATIVRGNLGWFLEILHPDVCKGHGLKQMCSYLEIKIENCIAFGDGDNDYEFIEMAGRGIVMKNGRDIVKKVADEIIKYTNDEDGVIKTLQQMENEGFLEYTRC